MKTYLTETDDRTRIGADIEADSFESAETQVPDGFIVVGRKTA